MENLNKKFKYDWLQLRKINLVKLKLAEYIQFCVTRMIGILLTKNSVWDMLAYCKGEVSWTAFIDKTVNTYGKYIYIYIYL